jgi:two-component system, NarL family, vancomycin resistance associated response regulator VraR
MPDSIEPLRPAAEQPQAAVVIKTVLIVDDSPEVRHVVRTFLEREAMFKVCGEAGLGTEAVVKAEELKPDIILLDLLMPQLNGIEAAAVLRLKLPKTQIVLFSNYTDDIGRTLPSTVGIDLVVPKGSLTDLVQSLKTLISRKAISAG